MLQKGETGSSKSKNFSLHVCCITFLKILSASDLPAGSRNNGEVSETLTEIDPSVTITAPSTGAICTVYFESSAIFFN